MTVICAWCGQMLKHGTGQVSHGICERCSRHFEARAARLPRRNPTEAP